MELVYGNDGMNYRTLARSGDTTAKVEQQLLSSYVRYYFPENPFAYTSPETEPESIIYVTSDLARSLPGEFIILTKNGRMREFSTPSFYSHSHLIKADAEYYKNRFFEIFSLVFLTDLEAKLATDASLAAYQPEMRRDIQDHDITKNQLKSVLYYAFYYEQRNNPVKIVLDKTGDDYNKRSREVLKAVYQYLPYDYRKRYGFATYMDEKQASVSRVKFELYDRAQVKKMSAMDVDLANCECERIKRIIARPQITDFVDKLVEASEQARIKYFDFLDTTYQGKRINLKELLEYNAIINSWQNDSVKSLLPIWIEYVYSNCMKKGPLYENVINIIRSRIDNDTYNHYLMNQIRNANVELWELPESIRRTILFADYIPELSVDADELIGWDAEHQHHVNLEAAIETDAVKKECIRLKGEIDKIEKTDVGINSFKVVQDSMIDIRRSNLEELEEVLNSITVQRKDTIDKIIYSSDAALSSEYVGKVTAEVELFKDDSDLYKYAQKSFGEKIKFLLTQELNENDISESDITEIAHVIKSAAKLLEEEDYQICSSIVNNKTVEIQKIAAKKESIKFDFKKRSDLIKLIEAIYCQIEIQEQYPEEGERIMTLNVGKLSISEKLSSITSFCEFLIAPDERNLQQFWNIDVKYGHNELLLQCIEMDLLSMDHVVYLDYIKRQKKKYIPDKHIRLKIESFIERKDKEYERELDNISLISGNVSASIGNNHHNAYSNAENKEKQIIPMDTDNVNKNVEEPPKEETKSVFRFWKRQR